MDLATSPTRAASPSAYTAVCVHCARILFRRARRLGELQVTMMESHVLICRPLATLKCAADVLAHCRIIDAAED